MVVVQWIFTPKKLAGMDANGFLNDPASRWGGIMRPLQINNFEEQNIEFIQMGIQTPNSM